MAVIPLEQAMALGAGIGVGLVALAYMAGHLLNAQSIKAYAKSEFGELFVSAIVVLLIIGLEANVMGVIQALAPPSNPAFSPPTFSPSQSQTVTQAQAVTMAIEQRMHTAMQAPLQGVVESLARSSMRLSKLISYNYNYQVTVPYTNPTGSASPASGGMMLQFAMIMGTDSAALNLLLAGSMKIIYVFLAVTTSMLLLPLGIVLRFIPLTRQLGSLLLAIALAVHFVFPIAVLWSTHLLYAPAFAGPVPSIPVPPSTSSGLLKMAICNPVLGAVTMAGEDLIGQVVRLFVCIGPWAATPPGLLVCADPLPVNPLDPPIIIGTGLQHFVAFYVWLGKFLAGGASSLALYALAPSPQDVINKAFNPLVENVLPAAVSRNLAVVVMVVIQLVCSIVLAKNFAQVLGAENQLYGLSRMV